MAVVIRESDEREYRIVCTGVSAKEFVDLQRELDKRLVTRTLRRNPFVPEFDSRAVHEIIVQLGATGAAGYVGKKVVDIIVDVVKRKLEERDARTTATITIYDHNGKPRTVIKTKSPRPKR